MEVRSEIAADVERARVSGGLARSAAFPANSTDVTETTTRRTMNHASAETQLSIDGPLKPALDTAHVDEAPIHVDEAPDS